MGTESSERDEPVPVKILDAEYVAWLKESDKIMSAVAEAAEDQADPVSWD